MPDGLWPEELWPEDSWPDEPFLNELRRAGRGDLSGT
jgi:hypothetical protein